MIHIPQLKDAVARSKATLKRIAKAGIGRAAHLVGKSPALKKLLIRTIKRFPAVERRMRASVNAFDSTGTRHASSGDLSPAAQAVLRRLLASGKKN